MHFSLVSREHVSFWNCFYEGNRIWGGVTGRREIPAQGLLMDNINLERNINRNRIVTSWGGTAVHTATMQKVLLWYRFPSCPLRPSLLFSCRLAGERLRHCPLLLVLPFARWPDWWLHIKPSFWNVPKGNRAWISSSTEQHNLIFLVRGFADLKRQGRYFKGNLFAELGGQGFC